VAFIISESANAPIQYCHPVLDRIICVRLKANPVDMVIIQVYAPTNDSPESEIEAFYEQVSNTMWL